MTGKKQPVKDGRRDEMVFHDNVGLRLALGNIALRHLAPLNDIRLRQVDNVQ